MKRLKDLLRVDLSELPFGLKRSKTTLKEMVIKFRKAEKDDFQTRFKGSMCSTLKNLWSNVHLSKLIKGFLTEE